MDELFLSCESFFAFPKNLPLSKASSYQRNELFQMLSTRDNDILPLFDDEIRAAVEFWDYSSSTRRKFFKIPVSNSF